MVTPVKESFPSPKFNAKEATNRRNIVLVFYCIRLVIVKLVHAKTARWREG